MAMWVTVAKLILLACFIWYLISRRLAEPDRESDDLTLQVWRLFKRLSRGEHGEPGEPEWTGRALDVSEVSQRVRQLREDFVSEVRSHPQSTSRHRAMLAMTRHAVGRLPYFRMTEATESVHGNHETETHAA